MHIQSQNHVEVDDFELCSKQTTGSIKSAWFYLKNHTNTDTHTHLEHEKSQNKSTQKTEKNK